MRYDLRGLVAPLPKPFSPNGVDAPPLMTRLTLVARTPGRLAFQVSGEAVDVNGEKYPSYTPRKASDEGRAGIGEAGELLVCRMLFQVPKGVRIAKVRVWESDGDLRSTTIEVPVGLDATEDGKPPK